MRHLLFLGALVMLFCSSPATPIASPTVPLAGKSPRPAPTAKPALLPPLTFDPATLYARRSRRLVQSYLRLKLLQAREADLDRARLVIERKLGIGALLSQTPEPGRPPRP